MINLFLSAGEGAAPTGMGGSTIIMIVVMIAIFYFLLIRPENKKKKQAAEQRNNMKVGDEIVTIGGIMGTVCAVKDETFVIETGADRVRIEFAKWALSTNTTSANAAKEKAAKEKAEASEKKGLFGKKKDN
jgi:preprotein translocase subunit YajC